MVTAIVIPIIIIYFYWLTKKEHRRYTDDWQKVGIIPEESIIHGKVLSLYEEKERFYQNKFVHVVHVIIQVDYKKVHAKWKTPLIGPISTPTISVDDELNLYGQWDNDAFLFGRFDVTNHSTTL